jgi:hypothetical protein
MVTRSYSLTLRAYGCTSSCHPGLVEEPILISSRVGALLDAPAAVAQAPRRTLAFMKSLVACRKLLATLCDVSVRLLASTLPVLNRAIDLRRLEEARFLVSQSIALTKKRFVDKTLECALLS